MAVKYHVNLQTKEPNNNIGILRIRQSDEETQVLEVEVLDGALPMSYEGLQVFFCARIGQTPGLGIVEQKLTNLEMTDPKRGKLEYTFRAEDWQILGRQTGYFSFRKMTDDHTYVQQFSTRDFVYEVTKSIYSDGIKEVKKDGSTYVWTFEDLLRLLQEFKDSGESDFLVWFDEIKDQLSEDAAGNLMILYQSLRDKTGTDQDFREFESEQSFMKRVFNESAERAVNVKWFGAKGDGVTDDGPSIKAAHEFANLHGYSVIYPHGSYYLSEVSEIIVETDVDFCGSTILINDDTDVDNNLNLYVIPEDDSLLEVHELDQMTQSISTSIKKANKEPIAALEGDGVRFVKFIDANDLMYSRYGVNATAGVPRIDYALISSDGKILTDLTYDFTSITRVEIRKLPENRLTFKNGNFISLGQNTADLTKYDTYNRNISVLRSCVDIVDIHHSIKDDFANKQACNGFLQVIRTYDVTISDCTFQPRKFHRYGTSNVEGGTYELFTKECMNLILRNIYAYSDSDADWGFHAGSYLKNALVEKCIINRFDSHYPSDTITIKNSVIGNRGLTLTGYGELIIEDCTFYSDVVLSLRQDYGSFWIGNITFRRIKHYPKTRQRLIRISPRNDHDFGMRPSLGMNEGTITVDDYFVDITPLVQAYNGYNVTIVYAENFDTTSSPINNYFYRIGGSFVINNVRTSDFENSGLTFANLDNYNYLRGFKVAWVSQTQVTPNVKVKIKNCNLQRYENKNSLVNNNLVSAILAKIPEVSSYADVLSLGYTDKIIFDVEIDECRNVFASLKNMPGVMKVNNSDIRTACNISNGESLCQHIFEDCIFQPRYGNSGSSSVPLVDSSISTGRFVSCFFKLPIDGVAGVVNNKYDDKFFQVYNLFIGMRLIRTAEPNRMVLRGNILNCDSEFDMPTVNRDYADYGVFSLRDISSNTIFRKSGTTGQRPLNARNSTVYYDTTLQKMIIYNGASWL